MKANDCKYNLGGWCRDDNKECYGDNCIVLAIDQGKPVTKIMDTKAAFEDLIELNKEVDL